MKPKVLGPVAAVVTTIVALASLAGCQRTTPDFGEDRPALIVPSPFPRQYAWALMTFDGALVGEGSVAAPQLHTEEISSRYGPEGILIDFGHGQRKFHLELRPLAGTGRYIVNAENGSFTLTLEQGKWETSAGGVCSFNFVKVAAAETGLIPPGGGEIFDVDLGFVCAALGSASGGRELSITDGKLHAFLVRFPEA